MDINTLWSLRLGFSAKQSNPIRKMGIEAFLTTSLKAPYNKDLPYFLQDTPKTIQEWRAHRQTMKAMSETAIQKEQKAMARNVGKMKEEWINAMHNNPYPLREKMVCFWHNHFVSTSKKVKIPYWIYQHNQILRENAFGNFRELTHKILISNAMIAYLDNNDNKKDRINENLSRELLELFTLGIGNYTESDIKNGARALAGLSPGNNGAIYRPRQTDNGTKTYFGQKGNLRADDLVDIIFQQKNAPYLITQKILQWFIYDNPPENLVQHYGNYLRKVDYEIAPFLKKIFTSEFSKPTAGSKIKNPLVYALQLLDELQIKDIPTRHIVLFIRRQGMDLFNQPNVKGWDGGRSWLTSQIFLHRHKVSDLLCRNKSIGGKSNRRLPTKLQWDPSGNHKEIITELSNRLLFQVDENLQNDMESILKYDFNPHSPNAHQAVMRLFNFITKTPEFQLV